MQKNQISDYFLLFSFLAVSSKKQKTTCFLILFFLFQIKTPIGRHVHGPISRLVILHKEDNKLHVYFSLPKYNGVLITAWYRSQCHR